MKEKVVQWGEFQSLIHRWHGAGVRLPHPTTLKQEACLDSPVPAVFHPSWMKAVFPPVIQILQVFRSPSILMVISQVLQGFGAKSPKNKISLQLIICFINVRCWSFLTVFTTFLKFARSFLIVSTVGSFSAGLLHKQPRGLDKDGSSQEWRILNNTITTPTVVNRHWLSPPLGWQHRKTLTPVRRNDGPRSKDALLGQHLNSNG